MVGEPGRLTDIGRKLARLPVDPRLGRMIIEAGRNGCAREVLIIAAALSIQDPRERPADSRDAADAQHARFAEPGSDFLSLLNLWDYLREQQRELSGSAFRRMCRREYLHYLRVREWQDVYGQLRQAARELGIEVGPDRPARAAQPEARPAVRAAAESGPSAHVAQLAARPGAETQSRVPAQLADAFTSRCWPACSPTSACRTSRRRARSGAGRPSSPARADPVSPSSLTRCWPGSRRSGSSPPSWSRRPGSGRGWWRGSSRNGPSRWPAHLVRREYSEPHWDARRGAAMASERVTLYGLPLVAARRVTMSRIDPVLARELFIRHALVEGDWQTHHQFFHRNRELLGEAEELERRARRRGVVADDAALFAFYDRRIPADVTSARHFDAWWKKARQSEPDLLTLTPADLAGPAADEVSAG